MFDLRFDTPFGSRSEYIGKKCRIIQEVPHENFDFDEVGPMYDIEFENGDKIVANPEELFKKGVCIEPQNMFLNKTALWHFDVFNEEEQKNAKKSYNDILNKEQKSTGV